MTYDNWKTTPPDDDPDGDAARDEENRCADCGALGDDPCGPDCGCAACRAKEQKLAGVGVRVE